MILRRIAAILFLPVMLAFGSGVYLYLGTLKSKVVQERPQLPTVTKPKFVLPGTMFVVQEGRLFKLAAGSFTEIGPGGEWSQPTLTPDHTRLVAVLRTGLSSDLYLLDLSGHVLKRLTKDDSRYVEYNHWAFYPRVSPDGANVVYGYDSPKNLKGVEEGVDLSIWSMPLNGAQYQARRWTDPNWYTGGDVSPIPLAGGGLLFVRHSIDPSTAVHSQIYYQSRALGIAKALTTEADDCSEATLSPDGTQIAMVCSHGKQTAARSAHRTCWWTGGSTLRPPGRRTARRSPTSRRRVRRAISSSGGSPSPLPQHRRRAAPSHRHCRRVPAHRQR